MAQLMKCGHNDNAYYIKKDGSKAPCCAICDCTEVAEEPVLDGRKARCTYYGSSFTHNGRRVTCKSEVDSKLRLAFFKHRPDKEYDEYYCGCWGWD